MRIVLRKSSYAQQAVHDAGALVAINCAELAQAHGKIAIAVRLVGVDQDMSGTVHRLELIFGVVQLHRGEHVVRIKIGMARDFVQLPPRHVRCVDE